jgi:hypothetical protein
MNWVDARRGVVPAINMQDEFDKANHTSSSVLVCITDADDNLLGYSFAKYNHFIDEWQIENCKGSSFKVKAFAKLEPPKF